MKLPIYEVDAFHRGPFSGNPAAVCPLPRWPDDRLLQQVASQNNLSETAFVVPENSAGCWALRWFTPTTEVALCGHATLASAHVLVAHEGFAQSRIRFESQSGTLHAEALGDDRYRLDFPARQLAPLERPEWAATSLGIDILDGAQAIDDWILELESEDAVANFKPDFAALSKLPARGIIITARGSQSDFVSRFFGPRVGVNEDPVTGSAHCSLTPYWASRLGQNRLTGIQRSARGGEVTCELRGDRVLLEGGCRTYLVGQISL